MAYFNRNALNESQKRSWPSLVVSKNILENDDRRIFT